MLVAFTETRLDGALRLEGAPARADHRLFPQRGDAPPARALLGRRAAATIEPLRDADAMVERANAFLLANGLGSPGDKFVAVFGAPVGVSGTTNAVQVRVLG